jgi:SAM-dependent methyltransferase
MVGGVRQLDRSAPGADIARAVSVRRFDCWAADYDTSQLQAVLYGPVHEAVLRYARLHIPRPGRILDVGCGTGRLPARIVSACKQPQVVVGVDASTEMIKNVVAAPDIHTLRYACAVAEHLPFADAVFDLVVVTLSVSHWLGKTAGLAEISRVMAPGATLIAADVLPSPLPRRFPVRAPGRRLDLTQDLPSLITAGGLRIHHVEPIRPIAIAVNTGPDPL